jgi:2-oxoglutarate ferredoxin oxidoreductase subunit delta
MNMVTIDETLCKGCELCVSACPKKIIAINRSKLNVRGYNPADVTKPEQCTACAMCAVICPDSAIRVERGDDV